MSLNVGGGLRDAYYELELGCMVEHLRGEADGKRREKDMMVGGRRANVLRAKDWDGHHSGHGREKREGG